MMNKKFYLGMAFAAALASCSNEELTEHNSVSKLEAKVETTSTSRVGFDNTNNWSFYWHKGDAIWVNGNFMDTDTADKSKTATFTGYGVETNTGYAIYPYDEDGELYQVSGSSLTWNFPSTYTYDDIDNDFFESSQNIPMYAKIVDGNAAFKHLGAIVAIKLNNWEHSGQHVFTLTTSKKITGNFSADMANDTPVFVTNTEENDVVTINFNRPEDTENSTVVFYIPIPTGTYDINVKVKVDNAMKLSKSYTNFEVERGGIVWAEYGKSTLVGGDYETVSSINDINENLLSTEKTDLIVKVTDEVEGTGNTITIPATMNTETTTFSFTSIAQDATIKIVEADGASYDGQIIIEVPEGTATNQIEAYVPNGEVYIKQGNVTTLIASSKSNTTIIGEGAKVGTLTVKQGNVRIEAGGAVKTINRSDDNSDVVTYVIYEAATAPEIALGENQPIVLVSADEWEHMAIVKNADGLNEALANQSISTIALVDDLTLSSTLVINRNITFDGNGKTITFTAVVNSRMVEVSKETNGASLTLKNVTLLNNVSWVERGVNYNTNGTLTLDNVTIKNADNCSMNYAVNLPGSSDNCKVVINNCNIGATAQALNVWGENSTINVTNSDLYVIDNSEVESYSVISLNNDGAGNTADGSVVTVAGGSLKVTGTYADGSKAVRNSTANGKVEISDDTVVEGGIIETIAIVTYGDSPHYYALTTLQGAVDKAKSSNGEARMIRNIENCAVNTKAPYGNYCGIKHDGVVLNGQKYELNFNEGELHNGKLDNYGIMTSGGTIKNMTITGVFRAIMIMYPTETVYIDNVTIGDEDVCYAINTGEGDGTQDVVVTNSTIKGWSSYGTAVKSVSFTNCTFAQGEYYTNVFGRLVKPYVDCVFENCEFNSKFYIDLSAFEGTKVTLKNCTVNGVKLTTENWSQLIVAEDSCGEGQISVELKDGTYLTASNIAEYVVIE